MRNALDHGPFLGLPNGLVGRRCRGLALAGVALEAVGTQALPCPSDPFGIRAALAWRRRIGGGGTWCVLRDQLLGNHALGIDLASSSHCDARRDGIDMVGAVRPTPGRGPLLRNFARLDLATCAIFGTSGSIVTF